MPVDFEESQKGLIDPATVIEVEHVPGLEDGRGVVDRAEVQPAGRDSTELAVLDGGDDAVHETLLPGDRDDAIRNPEAHVDHRSRRQFHRRPARDDLARSEWQRREPVGRQDCLAAKRRFEVGLVGLALFFVHDDDIDETTRHLDCTRIDGSSGNHLADNGDGHTSVRPSRLGEGAIVPESGFLLHC